KQHGPKQAHAKLRPNLRVCCNATWIVVSSSGDKARPKAQQELRAALIRNDAARVFLFYDRLRHVVPISRTCGSSPKEVVMLMQVVSLFASLYENCKRLHTRRRE